MKILGLKDLVTYKGKDMKFTASGCSMIGGRSGEWLKFTAIENKGKGEIYIVLTNKNSRSVRLKQRTVEKLLDKKELVVHND